ncbi:acyltransferase [Arthrobacter caoxuetaonis]|uniref:Acyltransferase family protein n=1 Tax=Arthrobacter caoxuetaonis TaxID=2886935 RepID=A0A9X1SDB4_9MICC|nr:acyltransferase [Arthrobacter caoxuetaonis]MCC3298602.1 acyltransferase family protein [Arthrobacter caoxuetaonis]USQ57343.1 acyltransferase family protein [Arthrobacter caoxuetaonis]
MSLPPSTRAQARQQRSAPAFRYDIEGLRAVAVAAVLGNHLYAWPAGGYAGVDVFFVISGFLITTILVRDITSPERLSLGDFYRRRIRRLVPAAVAVLATTVTAAFVVFGPGRAAAILEDAVWSFFFLGNWRFAASGTDYLNAGAAVSPLQHFWSLGVEEQFYLAWPWLLMSGIALAAVLRCTDRGMRVLLLALIAGFCALTFVFALWETVHRPTTAYFSTLSRAWELGAGAMLAVAAPWLVRLPGLFRAVAGWIGLCGLALSFAVLSSQSTFPGPWALLPVASTVLLIAAGTGVPGHGYNRIMWPLTNPASRYVGRISYSLYLWHFPVIVFFTALFPESPALPALLVSLLLASLSFHFLEDPVRHSRWLMPRYTARERGRRYFQPATAPRPARLAAMAAATGLLASGLAAVAIDTALQDSLPPAAAETLQRPVPIPAPSSVESPVPAETPGETVPAPQDPLTAHTAALRAALQSPEWPALSPDPASFTEGGRNAKPVEWIQDGCLGSNEARNPDPVANTAHCVYGDPGASRDLVLYGDSVAMAYLPALRAVLDPGQWRIHVYTAAGCTPAEVAQTRIGGAPYPECPVFRDWAVQRIGELSPEVLLMASFRYEPALSSGATGKAADAEWESGTQRIHERLASKAQRTLVLGAPPEAKDPAQCATRFSSPKDCEQALPEGHGDRAALEARAATAGNPDVRWIDTTAWFCVDGRCPSFVGSTPLYADAYHLSAAGAVSLGPLVAHALSGETAGEVRG